MMCGSDIRRIESRFLFLFFLTPASHFCSPPLTHFLSVASPPLLSADLMLRLNCEVKKRTSRGESPSARSRAPARYKKERKRRMAKARQQQQQQYQPVWFIDRVALGLHWLPLRQDASLAEGWTGTVKEFFRGLKIGGAQRPFSRVLRTATDSVRWEVREKFTEKGFSRLVGKDKRDLLRLKWIWRQKFRVEVLKLQSQWLWVVPVSDQTRTFAKGSFTVLALFASVRLSSHWHGYHEIMGGVNAAKRGSINRNIFHFSWHCLSVQV